MIEVVFSHPDFYVVDKPAGIGFHDENGTTGFFNLCCAHFQQDLYPVHRLDKITSGLLIVARNKEAAVWFQEQFEQRKINKYYLALSKGKPKKKQGSVIGDMVKSRNSQWKLTQGKTNPAVTRFISFGINADALRAELDTHVTNSGDTHLTDLKPSEDTHAKSEHREGCMVKEDKMAINTEKLTGIRIFLVKPESGKTHQIRVAMKSLKSAILGDELYGGEPGDRGYLHACALEFEYNDEKIELSLMPKQGLLFQYLNSVLSERLSQVFSMSWPRKK